MDRFWLKHYPPGVPADIDPAAYPSVVSLFEESFSRHRDSRAYVCMDKALTFGEVAAILSDVTGRPVEYRPRPAADLFPIMQKQGGGSIACMSSVSAQRGGGILGGPHYSAAKAGVLGLAKAIAREFGPDNIRVNCVTPGLIQTDISSGKLSEEQKASIAAGIPLNRLGNAEEVAGAYLFLASDLSSYITGAVIDVNGGMLIHG